MPLYGLQSRSLPLATNDLRCLQYKFHMHGLDDIIGQTALKDLIAPKIHLAKTIGVALPHLLFCGEKEQGKMTFASAIAEELGVQFCSLVAGNVATMNGYTGPALTVTYLDSSGNSTTTWSSVVTATVSSSQTSPLTFMKVVPLVTAPTVANTAKAVDCCEDPTCPPGCTPECAENCLPTASVKTTAKTAKKTACCSEGSECCPDEACSPASTVTATAKTQQKNPHK